MGVYVEKEWRYRKSKNASESTFTHKINQIRKGNTSSCRKGSREVFVKFTKGAKSRAGIRNAIKYISRDYKLELLDSEGLTLSLSNKKGPVNYVKKGPLYLKIFMPYYPQIYSY